MKCLNKAVSLFLCLSIIFTYVPMTANAAEETYVQDAKKYVVPVISNEYKDTSVSFYEIAGKYYLDVQNIKDFTRCEIEETATTIKLVHGIREIEIEKASGHMTDSTLVDQGTIAFVTYDGKYLCEGIPMLVYLGAGCALRDNNVLEILMPSITIWESLMPDYTDYWFNIVDLYGGENNVKISLVCDILSDILNGVSGHGFFADADTHLEDALFEIIDVDMMKYESAQESAATQNQAINNLLDSDAVLNFIKTGSGSIDTVSEMLEYYADFYLDTEILKDDIRWIRSYRAGDLKEASELSSSINKQVYEQSAIKANLNTADNISNALDKGMLAIDTAITSYNLMQYDEDTRNLFRTNINKEIFAYAGYDDVSWNNVSNRVTNKLSSNASIVASTAVEKITKFAIEKGAEKGARGALSFFTSKANIYVTATQMATFVTSLAFKNLHESYSADMNAIWLNTVQYDIAQMASRMLIKERDEGKFRDVDSLEKLKNMFALYYRTSIAFSENMAISVNEFGGKNKNEWVNYFAATEGKSVSNYMAIYLWRITNCTIVPIVDYNELSDTLITTDWIIKYESQSLRARESLDWRTLYVNIIKEETWDSPFEAGYENDLATQYTFYDIDKNGIPEMFFTPNPGRAGTGWTVYTIEGNEAVEVTYVLHGSIQDIGNKTIISRLSMQGHDFFYRFTFDNGVVTDSLRLSCYDGSDYSVNGDIVTEQEYHSILTTYFDFENPHNIQIDVINLTHNEVLSLK